MREFKFKNLIVFLLILVMSLTPILVYADGEVETSSETNTDAEDIKNATYTAGEYKAFCGQSDSAWTAMGTTENNKIAEQYKNKIPDIAKTDNLTVKDYLALSSEDRIKHIKNWRNNSKNTDTTAGDLTKEVLMNEVAPIGLGQATDKCTETACGMVIVNSFVISSELQDEYKNVVDGEGKDYPSGKYNDKVCTSGVKKFINDNGDETFRGADVYSVNGEDLSGFGDGTCFIGDENKLFVEMTETEFANVVKQLWANGYYMVLGVRYKRLSTGGIGEYNVKGHEGYPFLSKESDYNFATDDVYFVKWNNGTHHHPNSASGTYNGKSTYICSNHLVYLVGVANDNKVYIRDPAWDSFHALTKELTYTKANIPITFQPAYIVAWQSDKMSPIERAGGKAVPLTELEKRKAEEEGKQIYQIGSMTYYAENDLSAWAKLDEVDINELFLFGASKDNLNEQELSALDTWEDKVEEGKFSFTKVLRVIIVILGILLTMWAIFFYLAYWLDRINNFVDIDFIPLLSLGKFRISEDETEASYGFTDKKRKGKVVTVNHRAVLKIVIVSVGFGCLMITGLIYKLVFWIISTITGWFK